MCDEDYGFWDMNRRQDSVLDIIRIAPTLASLVEPFASIRHADVRVFIYGSAQELKPEWFRKHLSHTLVARSEYGDRVTL
jgi:hypothetical protein